MYISRGKYIIRESRESFCSGLYLILLEINIDFFILELRGKNWMDIYSKIEVVNCQVFT